jgi:hypothetical protein
VFEKVIDSFPEAARRCCAARAPDVDKLHVLDPSCAEASGRPGCDHVLEPVASPGHSPVTRGKDGIDAGLDELTAMLLKESRPVAHCIAELRETSEAVSAKAAPPTNVPED